MSSSRATPKRSAAAVVFAVLASGLSAQGGPMPPGVTPEIHAAIARGHDWLAKQQAADGSWRNAGAFGSYPVAMTGLAGMALVAGGSTPTRGRHWREVRSAVDFLVRSADPATGLISSLADEHHAMYGHGFATMFLASVLGMEEDVKKHERLKRVLEAAVKLIVGSQSSAGGWIYQPGQNSDEGSVTVTQIQALRACHMAGVLVDKTTVDRAVDYVKRCQNKDGGIAYNLAMAGSRSQPAITAAGVAVFYNAGKYDDRPFVDAAVRFCKRHLNVATDTTGHHYYTLYYWTQALYQRGGADWDEHYARLGDYLLSQQSQDGSWQGDGVGPAYGSAVALTALQLPYSLVPIYQR